MAEAEIINQNLDQFVLEVRIRNALALELARTDGEAQRQVLAESEARIAPAIERLTRLGLLKR